MSELSEMNRKIKDALTSKISADLLQLKLETAGLTTDQASMLLQSPTRCPAHHLILAAALADVSLELQGIISQLINNSQKISVKP